MDKGEAMKEETLAALVVLVFLCLSPIVGLIVYGVYALRLGLGFPIRAFKNSVEDVTDTFYN